VRYLLWLRDLVHLDLGKSYKYNEPVWDVIRSRFPVSIYFGLIGFLLSYSVCVPLGVVKALRHGSAFDFASSAIVFVGYSIPGWALGAVLLVLFGGGSRDVFPLGGWSEGWAVGTWEDPDQLHHLPPVLCYGGKRLAHRPEKNSFSTTWARTTCGLRSPGTQRAAVVFRTRCAAVPIAPSRARDLAGDELLPDRAGVQHQRIGYLGFDAVVEHYAVVMGSGINTGSPSGNILSDVLYVSSTPSASAEPAPGASLRPTPAFPVGVGRIRRPPARRGRPPVLLPVSLSFLLRPVHNRPLVRYEGKLHFGPVL
jgi:hypothetical protein